MSRCRVCWRCATPVTKRDLTQWFFKITDYADELLSFEGINWPEPIRTMQTNWIGRSEGAEVDFTVAKAAHHAGGQKLRVFTTRPDTLFGASFVALSADHPLTVELAKTDAKLAAFQAPENQGAFATRFVRIELPGKQLLLSLAEVQAVVGGMLRWHPMITADLHGYVSTYFMAPAARPVNANVSGWPFAWAERVGRGNAAAFDRYGWFYFVRDNYDLYYPGYWDSWPSLTGATGLYCDSSGIAKSCTGAPVAAVVNG